MGARAAAASVEKALLGEIWGLWGWRGLGWVRKATRLNRILPAEPGLNHGCGNHQGSAHLSLRGTSKAGAPQKCHEERAAVGQQGKEAK